MSDETRQIATKCDMLTPSQRVFVLCRARGKTVAEASKEAGVSRTTPATHWDMEEINAAILEVQQRMIANPSDAFTPLLPKALGTLERALDHNSMDAAKEVFNRLWGKPLQRTENQNWDMSQFTLPELDRIIAGETPEQVMKDRRR